MKLKLLFLAMVTGLMTSCSSVKHTSSVAPVQNTVVSFTVADVNVSPEKVSKTTTWAYVPFRSTNIGLIKDNTEAALLHEVDADILIEPEYIIRKGGLFRGGSVTVTGYPAKLVNFHKMTAEEAEILNKIPQQESKKQRKRWLLFP